MTNKVRIFTDAETVEQSNQLFYIGTDKQPDLVPLGIPAIDEELGGLGPGAVGILAAATGVGKSSLMLRAMHDSPVKVGCVSLEDGPDVVGPRLAALHRGVEAIRIRRNTVSGEDAKKLLDLPKKLRGKNVFAYISAGQIAQVAEAVHLLCEAGCRMIWLDYIQKVRGHHRERRHEVAETFTLFQRACTEGNAAGMAISQLRRDMDPYAAPGIHHLKETGDLENEARIILLGQRIGKGKANPEQRVRFNLAKSTYGCEFIKFDYARDKTGTLHRADLPDHHTTDVLRAVENW